MNTEEIKSLAQLREEIDPQGDKADKEELIGQPLIIQKVKFWTTKKKTQAIRVIAIREDTGELVHFNGGQPMINGLEGMLDHLPFRAELVKIDDKGENPFWLLE